MLSLRKDVGTLFMGATLDHIDFPITAGLQLNIEPEVVKLHKKILGT
jgi:hypothetical protein